MKTFVLFLFRDVVDLNRRGTYLIDRAKDSKSKLENEEDRLSHVKILLDGFPSMDRYYGKEPNYWLDRTPNWKYNSNSFRK